METIGTSQAYKENKREFRFIIPERDNDGLDLTVERYQVLQELMQVTGGYTILPLGNGVWLDNNTGITHEDRVYVVFSHYPADRPDIEDLLRDSVRPWCDMLRQESLNATISEIVDVSQASTEALSKYESVTM